MSTLYAELNPSTPEELRKAMLNPNHPLYIHNKATKDRIMMQSLNLEELQRICIENMIRDAQQHDAARQNLELAYTLEKDEAYLKSVTEMYQGSQGKTELRDRIVVLEDKNSQLENEISDLKEKLEELYDINNQYQDYQISRIDQFVEKLKLDKTYVNSDGVKKEVTISPDIARKQLVAPSISKLLDINPDFSAEIKNDIAKEPDQRETILKQKADLIGAKEDFLIEIKAAGLVAEQMANKDKSSNENEESNIDTRNFAKEILRAIAQNKNKGLISARDNDTKALTQKALTVAVETEPLRKELHEKETQLEQNTAEITHLKRMRDFTLKPPQ